MEIKNIIAKITVSPSEDAINSLVWVPTTTWYVLIPLHNVNDLEDTLTLFFESSAFTQTFFNISFEYVTEPPAGVVVIDENTVYEELCVLIDNVAADLFDFDTDDEGSDDDKDGECEPITIELNEKATFCLDAVASLLNMKRTEVIESLLKDKLNGLLIGNK